MKGPFAKDSYFLKIIIIIITQKNYMAYVAIFTFKYAVTSMEFTDNDRSRKQTWCHCFEKYKINTQLMFWYLSGKMTVIK